MIRFNLEGVYEGWELAAINSSPDSIYFRIHTDEYDPVTQYAALRHLVKLYECALEELPSDKHPLRGGYPIIEQNDIILIELNPHAKQGPNSFETTYEELRDAVMPFLMDVFRGLDSRSSKDERIRGIEHMALNYPFLTDFRELYESLTEREVE